MSAGRPRTGPTARDSSDDRAASGALERAAALLDAFDATHRELTLSRLVERSGLPRSTVHRTAARMIELGWLDKPGEKYRIGNRLFELSGLVPVRHELREAVLPYLQDLYAAAKTTVQLGVLEGTRVLVVEKISGHRPLPMLDQVGGFIPAHCSGLGRAILAWSDAETVGAVVAGGLTRRTPRTITTADALERELAVVHEQGWAYDREEGNVGISCVAAPIFDFTGGVTAALSVTGPSAAVQPDRIGPAVRMAAAAASRAYSARRWAVPRPELPSQ
ncbi:IclR family transcriptional regulator [Amycolatopsis sp. NPDC051371]|uniref:IclR family transcriptional regulator n=1 Tax=Amycolatopsis sp. NPDC051371 TaxID=3155800 RepID=UPI00342057DB